MGYRAYSGDWKPRRTCLEVRGGKAPDRRDINRAVLVQEENVGRTLIAGPGNPTVLSGRDAEVARETNQAGGVGKYV
jgi:hypothetical protein